MYGVAGYDQQGAGDLANIMQMAASGWGSQITPFDIGVNLDPRQAMGGIAAGTAQLNERRKQELQARLAQQQMEQTNAQNELAWAKLGSAENVARMGQEGRLDANNMRAMLDFYKQNSAENRTQMRTDASERNAQLRADTSDKNSQTRNEYMMKMFGLKENPAMKPPPENMLNVLKMSLKQTPQGKQMDPIQLHQAAMNLWYSSQQGGRPGPQQQQAAAPQPAKEKPPPAPPAPPDYTPIHERLLRANQGQGFDTAPLWY